MACDSKFFAIVHARSLRKPEPGIVLYSRRPAASTVCCLEVNAFTRARTHAEGGVRRCGRGLDQAGRLGVVERIHRLLESEGAEPRIAHLSR